MTISFDYDNSLSEESLQGVAKMFIELGANVCILTSRSSKGGNTDLFETAKKVGIKPENIFFTNYDDKYKFTKNIDIHIDDDDYQISLINEYPNKCFGFLFVGKNENLGL